MMDLMNSVKRRAGVSLAMVMCLVLVLLAACGKNGENAAGPGEPELSETGIIHEPEFGGIYIKNTIEEFNALGFVYGDSVDVTFSNGYRMEDLPYYNGYYTLTGEPLLVAYPGYDYIKACINNGDDLWDIAGVDEGTTAEITLHERGKYLAIQEARDIHYVDDREAFSGDAVFANFRNMSVGRLKKGIVYRSASPCDNQHNRAGYVDQLMENAGVQFILNLADTDEKIQGYIAKDNFDSPYFLSLYEEGNVIPLAMNMNFGSDSFKEKVAAGMIAITEHDGPYLIHCTEGKDRTGFVCMLVEALTGSSYYEIVADYMMTYQNYYGINQSSDPEKYNVIVDSVLNPMIRSMLGDESADLESADLEAGAEAFLKSAGMTEEQIGAVKVRLEN